MPTAQLHHSDWPYLIDHQLGLQVHWFGRFAGYPEWHIDRSRLTPQMVAFFFVEESKCTVELNGISMSLQTNDLLIIRGGDEFKFEHDPKAPVSSLSACLALNLNGELNTLLQREFPRQVSWKDGAEYQRQFLLAMDALSESNGTGLEIFATGRVLTWLGYLLAELRAPLSRSPTYGEENSAIDRILFAQHWARERLSEKVRLDDWAASVQMNPIYFGRVFHRETGQRPMQWLNERRLQRAARFVRQSSFNFQEIAARCGFSCPYYFSKTFRKRFGVSPTEFRQTKSPRAHP